VGAPYGTSSPERSNVRNGYRQRDFDPRVGTLDPGRTDTTVAQGDHPQSRTDLSR
jgi:hypothetical protein